MKTLLVICAVLLSLPCIALAIPLPDTGQTKCYNNTQEITCPNPGEDFYGQDANYAPCNPHAYTKLDANGLSLPESATTWVMVQDNLTGLIWEAKDSSDNVRDYNNPHDADNIYSWYDSNPETNGGFAGFQGNGTDTEDFINVLNSTSFGGHSDWRLPTIKELSSLVDSNTPDGRAINTDYFPNTQLPDYWSSTTGILDPSIAWLVNSLGGDVYYGGKSGEFPVRAVRGELPTNHLVDNSDGTIVETSTGLMWEVKTDDDGPRDKDNTYTWQQALSYCENLSLADHDDWRLPNRNEMQSLVDYSRINPSIDPIFFYTVPLAYWSSTTSVGNELARFVYFGGGGVGHNGKSTNYYVRAVRGGQCDSDGDGIPNDVDNNGIFGDNPCTGGQVTDCDDNCTYTSNPLQEDSYPPQGNGIGDACDCEADFFCDGDADGSDASMFKFHFGRSIINYPCTALDTCRGDFTCDGDVDGSDASMFKSDFGRSSMQNPCPVCSPGMQWCNY